MPRTSLPGKFTPWFPGGTPGRQPRTQPFLEISGNGTEGPPRASRFRLCPTPGAHHSDRPLNFGAWRLARPHFTFRHTGQIPLGAYRATTYEVYVPPQGVQALFPNTVQDKRHALLATLRSPGAPLPLVCPPRCRRPHFRHDLSCALPTAAPKFLHALGGPLLGHLPRCPILCWPPTSYTPTPAGPLATMWGNPPSQSRTRPYYFPPGGVPLGVAPPHLSGASWGPLRGAFLPPTGFARTPGLPPWGPPGGPFFQLSREFPHRGMPPSRSSTFRGDIYQRLATPRPATHCRRRKSHLETHELGPRATWARNKPNAPTLDTRAPPWATPFRAFRTLPAPPGPGTRIGQPT